MYVYFQIELDLLRTLPNNKHYDSIENEGIDKLRKVLLSYSWHNPVIGYCQVSYSWHNPVIGYCQVSYS
jgi:hypothetical protein